jgi:hypothetical protein
VEEVRVSPSGARDLSPSQSAASSSSTKRTSVASSRWTTPSGSDASRYRLRDWDVGEELGEGTVMEGSVTWVAVWVDNCGAICFVQAVRDSINIHRRPNNNRVLIFFFAMWLFIINVSPDRQCCRLYQDVVFVNIEPMIKISTPLTILAIIQGSIILFLS